MKANDPIKILFLCTGNSCRSQMAEAILAHLGGGRFEAFSAGSYPAGFVHQLAIDAMQHLGISMPFAESQSWDEYKDETFDAVITLCDYAAAEECPNGPGNPIRAHWSLPDPAYHPGTLEERQQFGLTVAKRLMAKIEGLIALDWTSDRASLEAGLARLGEI